MSKYCDQCGNSLDAEARFCSNCGAPAENFQAGGSLTVHTGGDIGRDANIAGRDVHIYQYQPEEKIERRICRACNGTGIRTIECPNCKGKGLTDRFWEATLGCPDCGGTKKPILLLVPPLGQGARGTGQIQVPCLECEGLGRVPV